MIGAIIGDIVGSIYEGYWKTVDFKRFFQPWSRPTDDTVLTLATMEALLEGGDFGEAYLRWGRQNPKKGYGGMFKRWLESTDPTPYNSFGNGAGMRVSPVGWYFDTWEEVLHWAKRSAEVTHNHPEGIKGAQATAAAVLLARKVKDKEEIRSRLAEHFGYELDQPLKYAFSQRAGDVTCMTTIPIAIKVFMDSEDFEDALYKSLLAGWDSDTIGCIVGAIAEAYYDDIPTYMIDEALRRLPIEYVRLIERFYTTIQDKEGVD